MRAISLTALAVGVGAVAALLAHGMIKRAGTRGDRWEAVTVNLPLEEVADAAELPRTLAGMYEHIETRFRTATGDEGTEVMARPVDEVVSRADLKFALWQAKSLLETRIAFQPDSPSRAHPGHAGRIPHAVTAKSNGEGGL